MTPGGPPSMATSFFNARSSAASSPLAFSLPKAALPSPRTVTETTAAAIAVCLRKRLLLMIVVPPDGPCVLAFFAILVFLSSHAEFGREYPLRQGACQTDRKLASRAASAFVMSTVRSAAFSSVCGNGDMCTLTTLYRCVTLHPTCRRVSEEC